MKFKVGDKVKIIREFASYSGESGIIEESGNTYEWRVRLESGSLGFGDEKDLQKIGKRGRPKKEKQVKYIAIYDENDVDPVKKFYTLKELKTWIVKAQEDEAINFDSIEVYPVKGRLDIEIKTSVKLKGGDNK